MPSSRYINGGDELITIQVFDPDTHKFHKFKEQRYVLEDAPTLCRFFHSQYFQPHADTTLTFTKYPAICVETAVRYLAEEAVKVMHSFHVKLLHVNIEARIERLIKLFTLAKQLGDTNLQVEAWNLLRDLNCYLTPNHCIAITKTFYGPNAVRDVLLKGWANQNICFHLAVLDTMPEFVKLKKDSWLKFEYGRMKEHEALPFANQRYIRQQEEEAASMLWDDPTEASKARRVLGIDGDSGDRTGAGLAAGAAARAASRRERLRNLLRR